MEDPIRIGKSKGTYVFGKIQQNPHDPDEEYVLKLFATPKSTEDYPAPGDLVPVKKQYVTFFPWLSTRPTGGETKVLSPQPPDDRIVANFVMAVAIRDTTRTDFKSSALYARTVEAIIGPSVADDCGILIGDGASKVVHFAQNEMEKLMRNAYRATETELLAQVEDLDEEIKKMKERRKAFKRELRKFELDREREESIRLKKHSRCFSLAEQKKVNDEKIFKDLKR